MDGSSPLPSAAHHRPAMGFRLVTLCGSRPELKFDAMSNSQEIIEAKFADRGIDVRPVDLKDWSARGAPALLREIARERPDVMLMQYPTGAFGRSLGPVVVSAVQRIAPLVVMLHEFVAAHPLRKLAVGALLPRATLIGTTAERERAAVGRWYPWLRGRFRDIPIASNIPTRPWSPTQPPKVVYFGQIRPEKGLETFVECRDRLAPTMPDVEFQIVGATLPAFADYAARMVQDAAERGITVVHGPDSDEVADLLSAATVALLPYPDGVSFRRGSLFAAAACGVPVVTNIGPDTPDDILPFVERAEGLDDIVALTRRYLTDAPSRTAAHERSVRLDGSVGWDATVDQYVAVFQEAMGRANERRPP